MKLISIIQAQTSSKRLENKVLIKINKKPIKYILLNHYGKFIFFFIKTNLFVEN